MSELRQFGGKATAVAACDPRGRKADWARAHEVSLIGVAATASPLPQKTYLFPTKADERRLHRKLVPLPLVPEFPGEGQDR